jgi:O-antigen ligase
VLYSNGIIGLIPFAIGFLVLLYRFITQPDPPRDSFVINVLIAGYVEIDVMSAINFVPSFIFFIYVASDAWKRIAPNGKLSERETSRLAIPAREART